MHVPIIASEWSPRFYNVVWKRMERHSSLLLVFFLSQWGAPESKKKGRKLLTEKLPDDTEY